MSAIGKMKTAMSIPSAIRPAASDTPQPSTFEVRCIQVESKFCLTPYPISNLGTVQNSRDDALQKKKFLHFPRIRIHEGGCWEKVQQPVTMYRDGSVNHSIINSVVVYKQRRGTASSPVLHSAQVTQDQRRQTCDPALCLETIYGFFRCWKSVTCY